MRIENGVLLKVEQDDIKVINDKFTCVIPEGVTEIGHSAFWGSNLLESVTIPDSVKTISSCAFLSCERLQQVSFGTNSALNKIGWSAFDGCTSLTSIIIPATTREIEQYAFKNCIQLKRVDFAKNSDINIIGSYAFQNCTSLQAVNLGDNSNLSVVMTGAFLDCRSLTTIKLPESTHLMRSVFLGAPTEIVRTKVKPSSLADKIAEAKAKRDGGDNQCLQMCPKDKGR